MKTEPSKQEIAGTLVETYSEEWSPVSIPRDTSAGDNQQQHKGFLCARYPPQPVDGFLQDPATKVIPSELPCFAGSPPHTHVSQTLLPHHCGGKKKRRRPSGYHQSDSENTEDKSLCPGEKREVGGPRWSALRQALSAPLGSWPCITPAVHS